MCGEIKSYRKSDMFWQKKAPESLGLWGGIVKSQSRPDGATMHDLQAKA